MISPLDDEGAALIAAEVIVPACSDSISVATMVTAPATSGAALITAETIRRAEERLLEIPARTAVTATASRSSLVASLTSSAAFAGISATGTLLTAFLIALAWVAVIAKAEGAAIAMATITAAVVTSLFICINNLTVPRSRREHWQNHSIPSIFFVTFWFEKMVSAFWSREGCSPSA